MNQAMRKELLANSMVGRYRLGYVQVALLIAGTLFEGIINDEIIKLKKWTVKNIEKTQLHNKMDDFFASICTRNKHKMKITLFDVKYRHVFTRYRDTDVIDSTSFMSFEDTLRICHVKQRVLNFKWLRNKIMHGQLSSVSTVDDNIIDDFILFIWCELANSSFNQHFNSWVSDSYKGSIFDKLDKTDADYMIRGIDEADIIELDNKSTPANTEWLIDLSHFRNLYCLRDEIAKLKKCLPDWLKINAAHLYTNTLTTIDTTSAYIWMPLTRYPTNEQIGIYNCCVSILATPMDLRIYMDFGGMDYKDRVDYYDFLGKDAYRDLALSFFSDKNFYVFDTEWYSFIIKKRSMCSWLTDIREKDIEAAMDEVAKHDGRKITWNRMLHGFIFDRDYLAEHGSIGLEKVLACLAEMIKFNTVFEEFRKAQVK